MNWKVTVELFFLAPFAVLFLVGVAIETYRVRAAVRFSGK